MKLHIRVSLVVAFSALVLSSSCIRSYTCHCNLAYSNAPGLPDSSFKEFSISDTKTGAQDTCAKQSGTYYNNNITTVENCYLY
jgi:hypothetical protein